MEVELDFVAAASLCEAVCLAQKKLRSDDGCSLVKPPRELNVDLSPHKGQLVLDEVPGQGTIVTHKTTLEQCRLLGHGWHLEFDEDGFAMALKGCGANQEHVLIEDSLKFELCMDTTTLEPVIMMRNKSNCFVRLNFHKTRWQSAAVTVGIPPNMSKQKFDAVVYRWPRQGVRVHISAKSLYENLGLNQFKGEQWRWVSGSWRRWTKHMATFGLAEHIMPSGTMKELGRGVWDIIGCYMHLFLFRRPFL